jgi:uncharacterized coiled-coil DUF342 family protein
LVKLNAIIANTAQEGMTAMGETGSERALARLAEVKQQLSEARARIPKHTPPPALMAEIDELEEELARLQEQLRPKSVSEQIEELEEQLAEATARIPKHTPPPALMAEIDEMEEELERLRAARDAR